MTYSPVFIADMIFFLFNNGEFELGHLGKLHLKRCNALIAIDIFIARTGLKPHLMFCHEDRDLTEVYILVVSSILAKDKKILDMSDHPKFLRMCINA